MRVLAFLCMVLPIACQIPATQPPLPTVPANVPSNGIGLPRVGRFQGSVSDGGVGQTTPLALSLEDAISRGLKNNLGLLVLDSGTQLARAERIRALSDLLPKVVGSISETAQQLNLASFGFRFEGIPRIVGPFEYAEARAFASQNIFDWTAIKNRQAATQNEQAAVLSVKDGQDLVVQVVASTYFQINADAARIETTRAQVTTATALHERAREQHRAGTSSAIDELRAQIELKTRQQELVAHQNQRDKNKLVLGRVIGLPLGRTFELSDTMSYTLLPEALTPEQALERAYKSRADYQSGVMQVRAAEAARKAAIGERYPSLQVNGNYGALGVNPAHSQGTFTATASVRFNIFDGGRIQADVEQADAVIKLRKNELADLQGQIDFQVRSALLDLKTAADQVALAQDNLNLANEALAQANNRFGAGITDNLEVVQAQDSVATANQTLISSIYMHNLAKVSLARAVGATQVSLRQLMMVR
jgi:outer membrane protein TolC